MNCQYKNILKGIIVFYRERQSEKNYNNKMIYLKIQILVSFIYIAQL